MQIYDDLLQDNAVVQVLFEGSGLDDIESTKSLSVARYTAIRDKKYFYCIMSVCTGISGKHTSLTAT